jgi:hypothetical protein
MRLPAAAAGVQRLAEETPWVVWDAVVAGQLALPWGALAGTDQRVKRLQKERLPMGEYPCWYFVAERMTIQLDGSLRGLEDPNRLLLKRAVDL